MIKKVEYPEFHTFAEGVEFLSQGEHIDYEVKIGRHSGALLTRETWLEDVASRNFVDYDGMGNEIDKDGNVLGEVLTIREGNVIKQFGDPAWIKPSEAKRIRSETAYILWYNK